MKACFLHAAGALAITFGLAACIPSTERPEPAPAPAPVPVARPAPVPPADPAPPTAPPPVKQQPEYDNYLDAPQTPGTWSYIEESAVRAGQTDRSLAVFGSGSEGGEPVFMLVCDLTNRQIGLAMPSEQPGPLTMEITTETANRVLEAETSQGGRMATAILVPADPLLDAMAITKGRFAIGLEGERTLYLPAWAEVTRVIEDCR